MMANPMAADTHPAFPRLNQSPIELILPPCQG
jgi:hypothetical protein